MIGQTISHYKILEKLGEGGMGVVYKALDTKLNRHVALKFLPPCVTEDAEEKARFVHEAQAISSLNHPHIATIHDVEEIEEHKFIVLEYIEGGTLKRKVKHKQLPLREVLDYAVQIAEGLAYAHKKDIVHRDVKTDNMMMTGEGQIKIADFGLAKLKGTTKVTRTGSTVGTAAYMSPEQAQGGESDHRSDIFSFGVVLYELITGEIPFKGEHEAALLYEVVNTPAKPLKEVRSDVPDELERIVGKGMEKNAGDRYQHVDEMLIDLKRLKKELETEEILKKTGVRAVVQKKKLRWLVPASVVAGIAALVIGYIVFQPKAESGERIPVAVVDFVNETKEEELDGLSGLLITSLEQSRRLSVVTRSRMFDILKQLGKGDVERIDETLGREICKQANVNALLMASVRKFGQRYTIDLKVLDPQKDEYLFTAREEGEGQENIPSMIDKLAQKTRVGLKEKAAEIHAASRKVAEVATPNLEAYQHYFKGEELVGKLKWEEAKAEFNQAIALDTTFALAYYRLAYAMGWNSEEGAKEPIRKAMEYIEKVPEKERYLIRAQYASIEGNIDEAIAIYQELLKLYPEEKEALYDIGDQSFHQGNYGTAVSYLEKVLAIDPTFARALGHIIWTYRNMGQYDKMLEYAEEYVAKAPSENAYFWLGQAYNLRAEFNEAFQTYGQALELFPTSTMPVVGMGVIYIFKDDYEKAEVEFRKLLQKPRPLSDTRDGYANLTKLYAYLGKYRETVKLVDKIIEIDLKLADNTDLAGTYAWKAFWLVVGRNGREQAEKAIEKGLELKKYADVSFYRPLFGTYLMMSEYEKASSIVKSQLSRTRPFLDVLVRAHVHQAKGEYEDAIRDFQMYIQRLGPGAKMRSGYNLAQCYFESGQNERAIEAIQTAQRIFMHTFGAPWRAAFYPRGFYLLGKIYEKKGDERLAIENYEKFLDLWKDADGDLPDLIDVKARLAKLKGVATR